jgi:hypothetical protein
MAPSWLQAVADIGFSRNLAKSSESKLRLPEPQLSTKSRSSRHILLIFFSGIANDIKQYIQTCHECQLQNHQGPHPANRPHGHINLVHACISQPASSFLRHVLTTAFVSLLSTVVPSRTAVQLATTATTASSPITTSHSSIIALVVAPSPSSSSNGNH